jgi:hypothetical protein
VGDLHGQPVAGYPLSLSGHLVQCLAAINFVGVSYAEEGIQIAEEVGDASVLVHELQSAFLPSEAMTRQFNSRRPLTIPVV